MTDRRSPPAQRCPRRRSVIEGAEPGGRRLQRAATSGVTEARDLRAGGGPWSSFAMAENGSLPAQGPDWRVPPNFATFPLYPGNKRGPGVRAKDANAAA